MKTKEVLIVLVLSLFSNLLAFSQFISIELSVKWTKGYDIFKEDSVICYPELSITYRNNSDTNFYFLKVSDSRKGNPMLPWGTFYQYPYEEYLNPDYKKRAISHFDYTNTKYTVIIGGSQSYNKGWIVYNDKNMEDEQPIDYKTVQTHLS